MSSSRNRPREVVDMSEQEGVVSDQAISSRSSSVAAPRSPASCRRSVSLPPVIPYIGMHWHCAQTQELWSIGARRLPQGVIIAEFMEMTSYIRLSTRTFNTLICKIVMELRALPSGEAKRSLRPWRS